MQLEGHPCTGLLKIQKKKEFRDGPKPDCLVNRCKAMAIVGSQPDASAQALAASEGLGALLKQSDEVEQSRKLLRKRKPSR